MAQIHTEVFHRPYLPRGSTEVHAIVRITGELQVPSVASVVDSAGEILIIDTSSSMKGERLAAAQQAARVAVDEITEGAWFALIAGNEEATRVFPYADAPAPMVQMTPEARSEAHRAIGRLTAGGGTAMGSWVLKAARTFQAVPVITHRHAIMVADGRDVSESPGVLRAGVEQASKVLQCDCLAIGDDWDEVELKSIAQALSGTVEVAADAAMLSTVVAHLMQRRKRNPLPMAQLRIWTPISAQELSVRQVAPSLKELGDFLTEIDDVTRQCELGPWVNGIHDFHLAVRLPAQPVGTRQLAARLQLVANDGVVTQGLLAVEWTADADPADVLHPEVTRYFSRTLPV